MSSLHAVLDKQAGCDFVLTPETFTLDEARKSMSENGLVILRNFISDKSLAEASKALAKVIRDDYLTNVPAELLPEETDDPFAYDYLRSPAYGRGNASFGFLFPQPTTWDRSKLPKLKLSQGDVYLERMGAYANANVSLVAHDDNQAAMAALFALTNPRGMISFDSAKVCDYKTRAVQRGEVRIAPTKRKHTPAHFDLYSAEGINRAQAMIFGKEEGDVTLCFGRYTHLAAVQTQIAALEGNKNFFLRTGFVQTSKPELLKILSEKGAIIAPEPGDMVIWKTGVLHAELDRTTRDIPNLRKVKNGRSLRFVVGTNLPVHLSEKDRVQVASAALQGLVPHPYIASPGLAYANVVCRKSTMYKKVPAYPSSAPRIGPNKLEGVHPRVLHCLGLSANPAEMYDDPVALAICEQL